MKYVIVISVYLVLLSSAVFDISGVKYFVLADDSMISMWYAKTSNFSCEGYSNFLWVGYMALWQWLPHNFSSLPIALTNLALILCIMSISKNPLLVGLSFPLMFWGVRGMEFIAVAFLFLWGLKFTPLIPAILITLLRIDGFVFALILLAYNFKPKDLMIWGIVFLSYYFARVLYFGDVFSNTYYLKLGYPFLERLEKVWKWEYLIFLLSPRKYILPILGVFAYHLYTGGDAWEQYNVFNRFLTITVPVLFESESFKDTLIGSYR